LALKRIEAELKDIQKRIDEKMGVKESDTGLARPDMWDLMADKVSPIAIFIECHDDRQADIPAIDDSNVKENIPCKSPGAPRSSKPDPPRLVQAGPRLGRLTHWHPLSTLRTGLARATRRVTSTSSTSSSMPSLWLG
jgi:hypothetical protein